jgi:hypothetical protein
MSRGGSATIAAVLTISWLSFAPAQADPTPAPTISADPYKAAMDQFKRDRDTYLALMRDRESKMRDINLIFKSAVDKANLDARNALATATTPLQKSTIAATRRNAIDTAINARDTAIAALGDMPLPPVEPARQPKQMGLNNPQGKQRR